MALNHGEVVFKYLLHYSHNTRVFPHKRQYLHYEIPLKYNITGILFTNVEVKHSRLISLLGDILTGYIVLRFSAKLNNILLTTAQYS